MTYLDSLRAAVGAICSEAALRWGASLIVERARAAILAKPVASADGIFGARVVAGLLGRHGRKGKE